MATSEKREYQSEDMAKRQQRQWQQKGYKVTRRKNALYIRKTWRRGRGGSEVEMRMIDPSRLSRQSQILFDSGHMACGIYSFPSKAPTEPHAHPETDVVEYAIQGKGLIWANAKSHSLAVGAAIHMPVDAWHTYQCDSDEPFVFFGALDKRRTYRTPWRRELERGVPGRDATVVKRRAGRTVRRDGKTVTLLIEPSRVGPKTMGLGVACYAECASGMPHSHADCEQVLYVQSGRGVFAAAGDEVMVGSGFAAFIPPGVQHQICNAGRGELRFIFAYYPLGAGPDSEYPAEL
jgi:quercetin dioxygenase-like cupin family protein